MTEEDPPWRLQHFEALALGKFLTREAGLYFATGAGGCDNPKRNEAAFRRYSIRPRVLRDVSNVSLDTRILNSKVSCPIGVSPTALHGFAHPDAEIATARACEKEGCIFTLSSVSSKSQDEVASTVGEEFRKLLWMQVYILRDRRLTLSLLRKAEHTGYSAVVVTLDSPVGGLWRSSVPPKFFSMPGIEGRNHPVRVKDLLDASLTFDDLLWLKKNSNLPVVAKGIMTGEDAHMAAKCGVDAILVSNHGGRQIEGVRASIDALGEVVHAVRDFGVEVYMDGGVRTGSDVFVALALGARAVFVGRPCIWGLAVQGEDGVRKVLQILKTEFLLTMQLAGVDRVDGIDKEMVQKSCCQCHL